jgi:hypothetical protein
VTQAVIQELRRLQGFGLITLATCERAERYVVSHPELFSYEGRMTATDGATLAIECTAAIAS